MRWDSKAVSWWLWHIPMRGGSAGHAPDSIGVGKPAGCGQACRQRWLPCVPGTGTLSARSRDAGPEPVDTACTTISPLFLVAMHPEAVAAFPTPTGRMWDFPGCEAEDGCETQQRGALQAGMVTQPLAMGRGQYRRALPSPCAQQPKPLCLCRP